MLGHKEEFFFSSESDSHFDEGEQGPRIVPGLSSLLGPPKLAAFVVCEKISKKFPGRSEGCKDERLR